ncbi:ADP-ribosylglycohydrolase family protein [Saccharopolyspora spinosa]|uniref:ADP-ribosylglycohydrolase family protein n=1 Tax=Saccharopolyspora spinosa TaxID=60894 RepID=UPI001659B5B8|nr:ADP-ribosylglycohydrolase family protein [Saccharopolyspora spinosa]
MRDEQIRLKGWPKRLRDRQSNKLGNWHSDWSKRYEDRAEFREEERVSPSDYNLHYLDVNPPMDAALNFDRRAREIDGCDPDTKRQLPDPDPHERFRGAVLAAAVGDAFGAAVDAGAVRKLPWKPSVMLGKESLVEYVVQEASASPTAVTQLLAFTIEGLVRAHTARRLNPVDQDPAPEVQHAYQRWLYTQRIPWGSRGHWSSCGGTYAAQGADPDGWLIQTQALFADRVPNPGVVASLAGFARTGAQSTLKSPLGPARGEDVVPRAAMASIWSNELSEAFAAAVDIAVLTHSHPDDYLAAGTLAAILHQQLRGFPFSECLLHARRELDRWPGREKTSRLLDKAMDVIQNVWTPAPQPSAQRAFGVGGDGAEALGIAVYIGMASDYVREALLLAMNYTEHRSVVGAISGILIGAEFGVQAIPSDLRAPLVLSDAIETLAKDALVEFSPGPPADEAWLRRYPAW